jgi:hypothetical protein
MGSVLKEMWAELGRLATQGRAEIASALFAGHSFVPYGDGQRSVDVESQEKSAEQPQQEQGRELD